MEFCFFFRIFISETQNSLLDLFFRNVLFSLSDFYFRNKRYFWNFKNYKKCWVQGAFAKMVLGFVKVEPHYPLQKPNKDFSVYFSIKL